VKSVLIDSSPIVTRVDDDTKDQTEINKSVMTTNVETVADNQLHLCQTPIAPQAEEKFMLPVRSISDVSINLPQRGEKLPDKPIEYNETGTLTDKDLIGSRFQLDEDMSDCRSVYCK